MKVTLEKNGLVRKYDVGFNIWYFLFGAWVPMFKGEFGKSMKHSILFIFTLSIYHWVQAFGGYNKSIVLDRIDKGWSPVSDADRIKINQL